MSTNYPRPMGVLEAERKRRLEPFAMRREITTKTLAGAMHRLCSKWRAFLYILRRECGL